MDNSERQVRTCTYIMSSYKMIIYTIQMKLVIVYINYLSTHLYIYNFALS